MEPSGEGSHGAFALLPARPRYSCLAEAVEVGDRTSPSPRHRPKKRAIDPYPFRQAWSLPFGASANSPESVEARRAVARNFDWAKLVKIISQKLCERLGFSRSQIFEKATVCPGVSEEDEVTIIEGQIERAKKRCYGNEG